MEAILISMVNWSVFIICELFVFLFVALGSKSNKVGSWYKKIKPKITPPNFVFPIVWTILYFLIGVSLYLAWITGISRILIALVFIFNLVLNNLWSYLFFYKKNPRAAFKEIFILWLSILSLILALWDISRLAALLQLPYLIWVSFASYLNYLIQKKF